MCTLYKPTFRFARWHEFACVTHLYDCTICLAMVNKRITCIYESTTHAFPRRQISNADIPKSDAVGSVSGAH